MVSIIVPVYNAETNLAKCLNSLINQTYIDIEIIAVNDGSTDFSSTILDSYAKNHSRIKVVHKKNGGSASARNVGIKMATGKYIMFVDADDWIDQNSVQELFLAAENNMTQLVLFKLIDEYALSGRPCEQAECFNDNAFFDNVSKNALLYPLLLSGSKLSHIVTVFYSSSLIKNNGIFFDEAQRNGEDLLFMLEIFTKASRILYIDKAFYHYLYNSNSVTNSLNSELFNQRKRVYKKRLEYLKLWDMETDYYIKLVNSRLILEFIRCVKYFNAIKYPLTLSERYKYTKILRKDPVVINALHNFHRLSLSDSILLLAIRSLPTSIITVVLRIIYGIKRYL